MVRLIGLGNEWSGDDAAGLKVAQALLPLQSDSFGVQLPGVPDFHMFDGLNEDDLLLVVDACQGSGQAGTLTCFTLDSLPADTMRHGSSHGLGLQHWLAMKQELDGVGCRVLIYAIEMQQVEMGAPLSAVVDRTVGKLVDKIKKEYVSSEELLDA